MEQFMRLFVATLLVICSGNQVRSDSSNHKYKAGDQVPLYVNKVGPFQNPSTEACTRSHWLMQYGEVGALLVNVDA
ncbi:hypothetical protein LguiA_013798 [Lonicera macranthoides]